MVSITLSVPEEIREQMKKYPEINWSGFIRAAIELKVKKLAWKQEMMEKLESEKEFDEEAIKIGNKVKEGMWKKYKKEGW